MYPVTKSFNAACAAPGRGISCKAVFNGATELPPSEIQEIVVTEQFGSSDGVTIGAAYSSQCKITIYNQGTGLALKNGTFVPYVGLNVEGSTAVVGMAQAGMAVVNVVSPLMLVPKGKYYIPVDGVEKTGKLWLTVTGYDRMATLTDDYTPAIDFPATPAQMLADICTQANIAAPVVDLPDIQISAPYEGSVRQQIGWLAGLVGCNAKFDATGNLVFCWYKDSGVTIDRSVQYMDGLTLTAENAFTINSLLTGTEDNPISVGAGVGIVATNPYMTDDVAAAVFEKISGKTMMPCKVKWRGNPAIEAGDSVSVTGLDGKDFTAYIMEQRLTVKGGMSAESTCYSPADPDTAVESPTEQKLNRKYDALQKAFKDSTDKIIGADGGYYNVTIGDNGYPTGWTVRDTPSVEENTNMWIMSTGGLGHSKDGGATISGVALTMDGQINADRMTTGTLSAIRIQSDDGKSVWDLATGEMSLFNTDISTIAAGHTYTTADYSDADTERARQIYFGNITPTLEDYEKLDLNNNGEIDAGDLVIIRRAIAGQSDINFTAQWAFTLNPKSGGDLFKIARIIKDNVTGQTKEYVVLKSGYTNTTVSSIVGSGAQFDTLKLAGNDIEKKIIGYTVYADGGSGNRATCFIPAGETGNFQCASNDWFCAFSFDGAGTATKTAGTGSVVAVKPIYNL